MTQVFVSPDYSRSNPYQRQLIDGITGVGQEIEISAIDHHGTLMPVTAVREHGLPDVVHLHWLHPFLIGGTAAVTLLKGVVFLAQLTVLRLLGVRLVWTAHNVLEHEARTPRLERLFKHGLIRLGTAVIVHCPDAVETIREAYALPETAQIHVIPHGHYIDAYENEVSKTDARAELGLEDEFVFLYFGRIAAYKNVTTLIRAFSALDRTDVRLLVAGNPATDAIEQAVEATASGDDRVETTLQYIPDERVQYYLTAADVVVLPFAEILTSGSTVLAMSFARPVVVPEAGCIRSLVPDDGGITVTGTDQETLTSAMAAAVEIDHEAVGRANYRAVASLDWADIGRETVQAYRS